LTGACTAETPMPRFERVQTTEGDATALRPLGDTLVNMSVWG
jgi:hypothetical protein